MKYIRWIFILILLGGCSPKSYSQTDFDAFLMAPNINSYDALEHDLSSKIQKCDWGKKENQEVVPIEKGQHLFGLVSEGNELAFRIGLIISKCLDGGELSDFYRSAGQYFEMQPEMFLKLVIEEHVSNVNYQYMLIMIPLSTVDDIELQSQVINNRISILNGLSSKSADKEIIQLGLSYLEKEKVVINRIENQGVRESRESRGQTR